MRMKKRYKFLICNAIYVIAFIIGGYFTYITYGYNVNYFQPLMMSFILGLFMFNLIAVMIIVLTDGILNSGDVG